MELIKCPKCNSENTYQQDYLYVCSECFLEFNPIENIDKDKVYDSNNTELNNGDTVLVIKDLDVKGAPKKIKKGTKVKNIRLRPNEDHNIDCRIDGFGAMSLKSEFVKKTI